MGRLVTLSRVQIPHEHGLSDSTAQMFGNKWLDFIGLCLLIYLISFLIRLYLEVKELDELRQEIESEIGESRTRHDILSEYKNNPGHQFLTRSERRFRQVHLERQLKRIRRQERSRFIGYHHTKGQGTEPIENPAVEKFSRSQLTFQFSPKPRPTSHRHHVSFHELCIYTALPFLTFCIFCQSLRTNLTESYLLQFEAESEDELDLF